ncbi:MAG TPA: cyclic nucleotide-binding domain-containing protein [Nitriliruptorales bacterium]|nr:cyclic nucleotide-binding domain-containing protein [Nitriliruptorales bacterium]
MRIESSVTSLTWIPSEAISGILKLPFEIGMSHYDEPPPDVVVDPALMAEQGRCRFANQLRAAIQVDDQGAVTGYEHLGRSYIAKTNISIGRRSMQFPTVPYPDLRPEPEVGDGWVRFVQTAGGRTSVPSPRPIRRAPFVRILPPPAWTTLSLTIHADGRSTFEVVGASPFPRHWVYDHEGELSAKSGTIDFKSWIAESAKALHTPWGDEENPALVTAVETQLERTLSARIMGAGHKPKIRRIAVGDTLTEQGAWGAELYLLLDGVLSVEIDGAAVAEVGPGAILGERAIIEGGKRTATLRAVTPCKVAVASADQVDREALVELARGRRREDEPV